MQRRRINRRTLVSAASSIAALTAMRARSALSAPFPSMPVKVIVPYAPGGSGDIVARVLGEKVGAESGQTVVIENRSGADGVIGLRTAARAKPDGYTLVQMATGHVILPSLRSDLGYDLAHDFTPVFGTSAVPLAFTVSVKSDLRSFDDLAARARATEGGLNYASGGAGSISHLAAADLVQKLGIPAQHVPYRGFSGAVNALLGEQVQFICATIADVGELARAGTVRVLATTAEDRLPGLPDVPTMAELGFANFNATSWNAYLAPAHTPGSAVDRLFDLYRQAAEDPNVRERLAKSGFKITVMNGARLAEFIQEEASRWRRVIESNHIKIEA